MRPPKPEDITGVSHKGTLVHIGGCTCDFNELTHREWVEGGSRRDLKVTVEHPIFRVDSGCQIHGHM